jgi:tetratricopeptide (TPR) repeat protein
VNRVVRTVTCAALALGASALVRVPRSPAADKPAPPVEELVRDLGSPIYAVRERAEAALWKRGRAAIPALEQAAADPNPEVARRAGDVLDRFGWYVFPDTPADVLKRITAFRTGTADDRKAALAELLRLGPHGRAAVRAILLKDIPPATRDPLAAHLAATLRREVPLLLFDGKADEAAALLALHTTGTTPEGAADFAAFHALRGTLPAAIREAEAARKTARKPEAADLVLAHLYRASRDWPKARAAAAHLPPQPGGPRLLPMLQEEEGDWAALLGSPPPDLNLPAAYRLTFLRLTDKRKEFDEQVAHLREVAKEPFAGESTQGAALALLLNNRAADATDLLLARRQSLGLLSEILIARMRYKDALDLLGPDASGAATERVDFDLRRARVLALVGRRDQAVELFGQVAARLRTTPSEDYDFTPQTRRSLLRSELRVGLRDLACEHAALFVRDPGTRGRQASEGETVFDVLFGTEADTAETLYRAFRHRDRLLLPGPTMLQVKQLLAGTASKEVADDAVALLSDEGPGEAAGSRSELNSAAAHRKVTRLSALAAVCRAAGRFPEAEAAFAEAADAAADGPGLVGARAWVFGTSDAARPWLEYADFLYERGRFADAAVKYEAGWRRFPDQPLLLFLSGRAFAKAGNLEEGRRRMDLAHWVGLGNERVRGKFLEELIRRDEATAGKRETDLLLRACWSRDFYFGNVMNQAARAAALARDWPTAERCVQRALLVLIKTEGAHFIDTAAYLNVPHEMLVFRARGLLAAGKVSEAMVQARACLDVTPGHLELAVGMVPELDRRGRTKEADELFGRVWGAYRKVLADYPESPSARHALAALGAGCRRELDQSLRYATEAVAADPKSAGFRETLAEVHFRRGERAKALGLMRTLAEERPRSRLYRRQLARYRTGDVASPFPDVEE